MIRRIFYKDEYIVKAKDANITIKGPQYKKRDIDIKLLIVLLIIFIVMEIVGILFGYGDFRLLICIGIIITFIVYVLSLKWEFKIENRIIYIKYMNKNYIINYEDLVVLMSIDRGRRRSGFEDVIRRFLYIEYIENGKYKTINLPYSKRMKDSIYEVLKNFITKGQLDKFGIRDNQYFDIRDWEIEERVKEKKENENKLSIIMMIVPVLIPIIAGIVCILIFNG